MPANNATIWSNTPHDLCLLTLSYSTIVGAGRIFELRVGRFRGKFRDGQEALGNLWGSKTRIRFSAFFLLNMETLLLLAAKEHTCYAADATQPRG